MPPETERLFLLPLKAEELSLWISDIFMLEKHLSCRYSEKEIPAWFKEIISGQISLLKADPVNYLWNTFWFIIRKSDREVVGSLVFKGPPDDSGKVEIGYGLLKQFEHNGYMRESLSCICEWALKQHGVFRIVAETEKDNLSSQKLLKKCGFKEISRKETIWWQL